MTADPATAAPPRAPLAAVTAEVLRAAGALDGGWACEVTRVDDRAVRVTLGPPGAARGVALVWHEPAPRQAVPSLVAGPRHAVSVEEGPGAWSLADPATPRGVRRRGLLACRALAALPQAVGVALPASEPAPHAVALAPGPFERWLAPTLRVGAELADGWRLADVHPAGEAELGLTFARDGGALARVLVRPRDDAHPATVRTRALDLRYQEEPGEDSTACIRLAHALAARLERRDAGVRFVPEEPEGFGEPAFNLSLPAPCEQHCAFCSGQVRDWIRRSVPDDFVPFLRARLTAAAAEGRRVLRINGIEPLNAPYLVELMEHARDAGFTTFELYSTFRPLGDPALADRFCAALPERFDAVVPLYGSTAARHDALVGVDGAFEAVLAGVRHVRERWRPGWTLRATTVLMRQVLDDLPALAAFARELTGDRWGVHLPYPTTALEDDRYFDVAVSMTEAVEAAWPDGGEEIADLRVGEVVPCVMLRHQRRTGHALLTPERLDAALPSMAGTHYRTRPIAHSGNPAGGIGSTPATVRCPHRDACALAAACPGSVYALYARRFGTGELAPADAAAVRALPRGEELLARLRPRPAAAPAT